MEFLLGMLVGAFSVTILPISLFWMACRVMGGKYSNYVKNDKQDGI